MVGRLALAVLSQSLLQGAVGLSLLRQGQLTHHQDVHSTTSVASHSSRMSEAFDALTKATNKLRVDVSHVQSTAPKAEEANASHEKTIFIIGPSYQPMVKFAGQLVPNCTSKCRIQRKPKEFAASDAVVWNFLITDNPVRMVVPFVKHTSQKWVFNQYFEAQMFGHKRVSDSFLREINGRTDYTMTFAPDSDIHESYHVKIPLSDEHRSPPARANMAQGKQNLMYAAISDCKDDRLMFSRTLMDMLSGSNRSSTHTGSNRSSTHSGPKRSSIYGACGKPHPCPSRDTEEGVECSQRLRASYKFVAAFENNRCRGYITEKPWEALLSGAVPVVVGGTSRKDYESVLPEGSFIYAEDFASLQKLADYLLKLDHDDIEYNKYHEWRYTYRISTEDESAARSYCGLCEKLHEPAASSVLKTSHKRLTDWWFNDACKSGYPWFDL
eukprot:TRINITY_DN62935_c0_g1_i4.p1 TRINITY_DN62935_c0_g1~~TRINITY_DN62935_c0_g1_i4.p1  ORF type:complete len:440 (+),score=60.32 TRINITY_DN62935_c0_g1_i4:94-1413(+)